MNDAEWARRIIAGMCADVERLGEVSAELTTAGQGAAVQAVDAVADSLLGRIGEAGALLSALLAGEQAPGGVS